MDIDISKIIQIPSDTEIPVHNHPVLTKRPLCTNFPENGVVLEKLEGINVENCTPDLFNQEYKVIKNIDELKKLLSELLIKFDTNPSNLTKVDYALLLKIIYQSLLHLYQSDPESVIVTEWEEILSDNRIPSERLVKRTIDRINENLNQEVLDRNLADNDLLNTKQDKLIAGTGIDITDNVISNTQTSAEWGNILGTLSDLTDLLNALDNKANVSDVPTVPTNVSAFNNDVGYLTSHLDISGKENKSNKVTSISSSSTNTQYPSAKCVYDEFTTTVTSDNVSSVGDVTVCTNLNIQVIDKTQDASSTFAIDPNKMYMFGTKTSLTITLNPGESGIVNEYMFQFTSGNVATTLNVPSSVTWLKDPDIQTGKKYAVSIENNLGVIGEWSNE